MGASCCQECKGLISREKTNEFIEENENGNNPIPSEKKVSFSEFNPKKLEKKKLLLKIFLAYLNQKKKEKAI